ncbi:GNAT family N-acetyltransferase [Robertkochia solimangrovi]|uniref:GNAT family N-acetyltransferase n=1 Tax=Robertkochia solimangrovi TaxID=2213046 RepID=UPI0011805ADE|nr:GNAT family protein [Robertkochia solimangrovi]TRZ46335.1 N-acetyltransferase [Robertkochia solimangrovi]
MKLMTSRLLIRPIAHDDSESVFAYRKNKEVNKYQGWIPESLPEVTEFINKTAREPDLPETWFQLVIIENASGRLMGDIGLHFFGIRNEQVEIGCTLHQDFQGKGFATEALESIITFLFTELNKHRIIASIDPENLSVIRLLERTGFQKEAHFRKSLFLNDQWVDDVIFAMLRTDWKNSSNF